ncbi:amino acid ABC transporter permease [Paraburkholderia phenazinium]|uniref:Glutamate/aspartate import permease protein GltK n=1 Tax=Paraburkholderia phenazinium TaxID=60549 RepID=A0A1G8IDI5_9BURK|nr:amino acid ABC transporter permease [Paraburkholderia phenazinium]SDI17088.1 amino acid ABC transporter membrane protein, PAAT family [Paraburkholderia phenazinium]
MLTPFSELFDLHGAGDYLPVLLKGAATSLALTVCIMSISLPLGLVIALAKLGRSRILHTLASIYIEVIRGTPALLQLFYIYFVLPSFGIRFDPFMAGVIGLSINYSAYLAEVYRAGIAAVPQGQIEAAKALGMSRRKMLRLIVLPQAIRVVIPPLGNYGISLFKDTSLVSIVTVKELIFTGQIISSTNFQYVTVFTIIGAIYLAFSYPSALLVRWLERRMSVGSAVRPVGSSPQATAATP